MSSATRAWPLVSYINFYIPDDVRDVEEGVCRRLRKVIDLVVWLRENLYLQPFMESFTFVDAARTAEFSYFDPLSLKVLRSIRCNGEFLLPPSELQYAKLGFDTPSAAENPVIGTLLSMWMTTMNIDERFLTVSYGALSGPPSDAVLAADGIDAYFTVQTPRISSINSIMVYI